MICYMDSSVALRIILNAGTVFTGFSRFEKIGASELLLIECHRVLDRYRMENILTDQQLAAAKENLEILTGGMHVIEMTEAVKERARGTFPTIIGTLDAIHLATALLWRNESSPITIASHDRQMNTCARALKFEIIE